MPKNREPGARADQAHGAVVDDARGRGSLGGCGRGRSVRACGRPGVLPVSLVVAGPASTMSPGPALAAARRPRRGRGHRRGGLHGPVDRLLPQGPRSDAAGGGAGEGHRRVRGLGAQRWCRCSALYPSSSAKIARRTGRDAVLALHRELRATVDEVGRAAAVEGASTAGYAKGGTPHVRPVAAHQVARAPGGPSMRGRAWGFTEDDARFLGPAEVAEHMSAPTSCWVPPTPRTARPSSPPPGPGPGRTVVRRAVPVYEDTTVKAIEPARRGPMAARCGPRSSSGRPRAHARLAGEQRPDPVYSLMLATEPLTARPGTRSASTAADLRRRTPPHHLRPAHRGRPVRLRRPRRAVPLRLAHHPRVRPGRRVFARPAWRAPEAVPGPARRCGHPYLGWAAGHPARLACSVGSTGHRTGWAGGYVGDGVATTNLAGRTLADLITGRPSDLTSLPWVGPPLPAAGSPSRCAGSA